MTLPNTLPSPQRRLVTFAAATGFIGLMTGAARACNMTHAPGLMTLASAEELPAPAAVDAVLRDLWIGHAFQVRNVVLAAVAKNKAAEAASEDAVVANAKAIAGAVKPFYGPKAEEALFKLLAGHYAGIKAYLVAALANKTKDEDAAMQQIGSNAEAIAGFLSSANPYLPKDDVMGLLQAHAGHHIGQIQQLIAKDYKGELETWADMSQHMYVIADALAGTIAKQFPEKFKA